MHISIMNILQTVKDRTIATKNEGLTMPHLDLTLFHSKCHGRGRANISIIVTDVTDISRVIKYDAAYGLSISIFRLF